MVKSDKSLTFTPHKGFAKKYFEVISSYINSSRPLAIVGAYGFGKGILCNYILNLPDAKYKVAYIDLATLPDFSLNRFFGALANSINHLFRIASRSHELDEDEFYWAFSEALRKIKSEKLVIVIRHSDKLLNVPSKVLDRLNNYLYDNSKKVTLIVFASLKIVNFQSEALNSLVDNNFVYLGRFDNKTALLDIHYQSKIFKADLSKYEHDILKYTHGVHGSIVFLCSLLAKYKPAKLSQQFIDEIANNHPKQSLFFDDCFECFTDDQVSIIYHFFTLNKLMTKETNSKAFKGLLECGIFYKSGKRYICVYDMCKMSFIRFMQNKYVEDFAASNKLTNLLAEISKNKLLTKAELIVTEMLIRRNGDPVTYDEINKAVWGSPEKFSMYAINKLVSRIRHQLQMITHGKYSIGTKYKVGYFLVF